MTPKTTKYMRQTMTEKQIAFLLLDTLEALYGGAAGGGKALALDTPILTDKGWKTIGTLTLEDKVLAQDGTWSDIEYITDVQKDHDCYEITFNNGAKIVADAEHLWAITEYKHRKYWRNLICTTKDLREGDKLVSALAVVGEEKDLPIDPYVLGYWLGDGNSRTGSITIGEQDYEEVKNYLPPLHRYASMPNQYTAEGLTTQLRLLGLLRDKHDNRTTAPETKYIPEIYFLSSFKQRLSLLQGIMDSDGSIQKRGRCEIAFKEKRLADDICTLLSSLGITYSRSVAPSSYKGKKCPSHRITFSTTLEVFRLQRKKALLSKRVCSNKVFVKSVKYVGKRDVKCIRIKHLSHIFLIGKELIPTHNSEALLLAALQYVDTPGYNAILFRRTYSDLALPGALLDRARELLTPFIPEVKWDDREKKWIFPSGATLTFGYLESEKDKYRYQSAEFQFIGFDELTQFTETQYTYLFSRLRRLKGFPVPVRMRAASNPGGEGHDWVKQRFIIEGASKGRIFIPARMEDNPFLDHAQYEESLSKLDPVTRAQLRWGNWDVKEAGYMFKRQWFPIVDRVPHLRKIVRYWDLAGTEKGQQRGKSKAKDPDWTVGLLLGATRSNWYILDVKRDRLAPHDVEELVKETAYKDGRHVSIYIEQEPGSSGLYVIEHFAQLLKGFAVRGHRTTGSKVLRANPVSAHAQRGAIKLVRGPWINDFLDELEMFPGGTHDDQVDALSGAFEVIDKAPNISAIPIEVGLDTDSYWTYAV
jgi:predicted phage terminase large subunit-like protein